MRCVIKAKALMHKNMDFKNIKDKEINIKAHKGFNMVMPFMPPSTDEKKYFHYSRKHRVQEWSIKVL